MKRIQKVQPLVYDALLNKPETRKDDFLLVLEVYKNFVTSEMPIETVFKHHAELGLPSFASVIRIRRILQKAYPELENAPAVEMRKKAIKDYKEYALNSAI